MWTGEGSRAGQKWKVGLRGRLGTKLLTAMNTSFELSCPHKSRKAVTGGSSLDRLVGKKPELAGISCDGVVMGGGAGGGGRTLHKNSDSRSREVEINSRHISKE